MGFCDVSLNRLRLSGIWEVPWSGWARVRGNLGQWLVTIRYRNISVYLTIETSRLWWPSTAHGNNIIEEADNVQNKQNKQYVNGFMCCEEKKKKRQRRELGDAMEEEGVKRRTQHIPSIEESFPEVTLYT